MDVAELVPRAPDTAAPQPVHRPLRRDLLAGATGVLIGMAAGHGFWPRPPRHADNAQQTAATLDTTGLIRNAERISVLETSPYRARITVAPAEQQLIEQTRTLPAVIEADPARMFNILPPLGGRVTDLRAHLGDKIEQGQPLVVIDSGDLAQAYADLDKARAQVELTRRTLDRARGLIRAGGGAIKDLESATNDFTQAEAEAARAKTRLDTIAGSASITSNRSFTVSAPASGTVTALTIASGAYINDPTQSMLTITNVDQVWITANVPEKDIGFVAKGQNVDVNFAAYPGETFQGTVLFINEFMEPDTRRIKIRIRFANPDGRFKPNMFASVIFRAPPKPVPLVPNSALLMNNDSTTVFVETTPWAFVRRTIQPTYELDGKTAVEHGLSPGERIVTRGAVLLND